VVADTPHNFMLKVEKTSRLYTPSSHRGLLFCEWIGSFTCALYIYIIIKKLNCGGRFVFTMVVF